MHNNLIAARDGLQVPQIGDRERHRPGAGEDVGRIWLDAVITPNVSLNNRVALILAASLILPGSLICLATAWMGAWQKATAAPGRIPAVSMGLADACRTRGTCCR